VAGGGTIQRERPAEAEPTACLTDDQLTELAALGRRVEDHYGSPQDCEWALDESGTLWLTQARPITTLFPLPTDPGPAGDGSAAYFCMTLAQGLIRPITPMGLASFRLIGAGIADLLGVPAPEGLAGPNGMKVAGQRAFLDITPALRHPVGRKIMLKMFGVMEARAAEVLGKLGEDPRFAVHKRSVLPLLGRVARVQWRLRMPPRALHAMLRPSVAEVQARQIADRLERKLALPAGATSEQRLDHVERSLRAIAPTMPSLMPAPAAGFLMLGLAARLLRHDLRDGELQAVLRGLPHNVTTEMDMALWQLASRIKADTESAAALDSAPAGELATRYLRGELPPVAQQGMAGFLGQYGHRAVAEIDLGLPRWSDDPTHLFGMLINYLRLDDRSVAPDAQFAKAVASAEEQVRQLVAAARRRGRVRSRVVAMALGRARALTGLREEPKYYLVVGLGQVRAQLAVLGAQLAEAGQLTDAEDVFFVDLAELRRGLRGADLRELVAGRRADYDREMRRRQIPRVLLSDGTEPEAVSTQATGADAADDRLIGVPASAGNVTGIARVVLDPVGAHLEPGEILIAPSTDPGWTPLFLTAGGLVMEMGGANSHGAVVAREYGIPAVVGVPAATQRIQDGQRIEVRGAEGCVITH